uniref:Thioesterase domain-containing protein n=1 Tax=Compsopogon caeruleus TaxID=31354 RepID=A0A7S1XGQ2_9RHOD|mmetsp:Transcript_6575/g.13271  ORF Transcript_6575/g.13271 Transcript_6575/m.13271 type:complete len:201 (+) Transcript_6575:105-707(+)
MGSEGGPLPGFVANGVLLGTSRRGLGWSGQVRRSAVRPRVFCRSSTGEAGWLVLEKEVLPQDTDYSGFAWHGTYVEYFEEIRCLALRTYGLGYGDFLQSFRLHFALTNMEMQFRRPAKLGSLVLVKGRFGESRNPRLTCECSIVSKEDPSLEYVSATCSLVTITEDFRPARWPKPFAAWYQSYHEASKDGGVVPAITNFL